ncbi:MAG: alpha/beta hydrolase [Planctomycetota bacterium]
MGRSHAWVCLSVLCLTAFLAPRAEAGEPVEPTHKDVRYSKEHERCVLDFWRAKTDGPAPLVVYFHGGGFKGGDKAHFRKHPMLRKYLPKGVSFASVNYPLTGQGDVLAICRRTEDAIRFLKSQAKTWNIDPRKIAVMGCSAGALISEYLAYWVDLDVTACFAEQHPYRSQAVTLGMKKGGPPLILYTRSGPEDKVHHPRHARFVKEYCDVVGIECEIYGSAKSGLPLLPKGVSASDQAMKLFRRRWSAPPARDGSKKPETEPEKKSSER